jgi:Mg/Co/Ni transporter MgtE
MYEACTFHCLQKAIRETAFALAAAPAPRGGERLERMGRAARARAFAALDAREALASFLRLEQSAQALLLQDLERAQAARIVSRLPTYTAARALKRLPPAMRTELRSALSAEKRHAIETLLDEPSLAA